MSLTKVMKINLTAKFLMFVVMTVASLFLLTYVAVNYEKMIFIHHLRGSNVYENDKWNLEYREALISRDRPMGYVYSCGLSFAKFDEDIDECDLWVNVEMRSPTSIADNIQSIKLLVDTHEFPVVETLERNPSSKKGGSIKHVHYYFHVSASQFLEAKIIRIKINDNVDRLITSKMDMLDRPLRDWHDSIVKTKGDSAGILIRDIRF